MIPPLQLCDKKAMQETLWASKSSNWSKQKHKL